jgi:phosphate transport system substrate-binding protein
MQRGKKHGKTLMVSVLVLAIAVVAGMTAGCRRDEGPAEGLSGSLVIRGSDTLVNLSAAWAEAFMGVHPGVQVSVSGGGSSTGFAALIDGSVELASASRAIRSSEREALEGKGRPAVEHVIGLDAVTMILHPSNTLESLTMAQLADILTGRTRNWREVGGPDQSITIYSRETSSGTYAFVKEHVMKNEDFTSSARLMPSTESILQAVAQDRGGIGYIGLGYVTDAVKALKVAPEAGATPVEPSEANAASGTYPLARPLFVYSAGETSELAQAFLDFCVSPAGRAITTEMGFVPPPEGN